MFCQSLQRNGCLISISFGFSDGTVRPYAVPLGFSANFTSVTKGCTPSNIKTSQLHLEPSLIYMVLLKASDMVLIYSFNQALFNSWPKQPDLLLTMFNSGCMGTLHMDSDYGCYVVSRVHILPRPSVSSTRRWVWNMCRWEVAFSVQLRNLHTWLWLQLLCGWCATYLSYLHDCFGGTQTGLIFWVTNPSVSDYLAYASTWILIFCYVCHYPKQKPTTK